MRDSLFHLANLLREFLVWRVDIGQLNRFAWRHNAHRCRMYYMQMSRYSMVVAGAMVPSFDMNAIQVMSALDTPFLFACQMELGAMLCQHARVNNAIVFQK